MHLPIEIEVLFEKRDVIRFHRYHFRFIRMFGPFLTTAAFYLLVLISFGLEVSLKIFPFFVLYYFLTIIISFLIYRNKSIRNYNTVYRNIGYISFKFHEEKIVVDSTAASGYFQWDTLNSIRSDRHNVYLYVSKSMANIIPKRYLSIEETKWILAKVTK